MEQPAANRAMTSEDFRAELEQYGLSQADFGRILQYLSGHPTDRGQISRWARGHYRVPPPVAAMLRLWGMVPAAKRHQLVAEAPPLSAQFPFSYTLEQAATAKRAYNALMREAREQRERVAAGTASPSDIIGNAVAEAEYHRLKAKHASKGGKT